MKKVLILLTLLLLAGCGPTAKFSTPRVASDQEAGVIDISLNDHHDKIGQPLVRIFPKYQQTEARNITNRLKQTNPNEFTLDLPKLQANKYRVVMELPYTVKLLGIPVGTAKKWWFTDFDIRKQLSPSCFRFDNKADGLMGWQAHGVYLDNQSTPFNKDACPGLFYINTNWPYPLSDSTYGGSLFVPVSSGCFPKSSPQLGHPGHWTFALVSPDLSKRSDWQHLQAVQFHMATRSINVSVKPEIVYQLGNTRHSTLSDAQEISRYDVNGGRWNDFEYAFKLPQDAILTHVIFHVYGIPEKTVSDQQVDSVFLDAVCPVK